MTEIKVLSIKENQLSINYLSPWDYYSVYVEEDEYYVHYEVYNSWRKVLNRYEKEVYGDYFGFYELACMFNEDHIWLPKPIPMKTLNYSELTRIKRRLFKIMARKKSIFNIFRSARFDSWNELTLGEIGSEHN